MALLPLESNPEVMNKFMRLMGVPDKWSVVDVYGLDEDTLAWVPKPVIALILLFPCSDKFYQYVEKEKEELKEKGQTIDTDLFFMKQYISNACGTVALIHSIANNVERVALKEGIFTKFLNCAKNLTPDERGNLFMKTSTDSDAFQLISAHQELALEGQTEANPRERVNHHFVALVEKGGDLYELDGRKEFPINHGSTTLETFLEDAAKVCKEFIKRDADDVNFTVMAVVENDN